LRAGLSLAGLRERLRDDANTLLIGDDSALIGS